MFSNQQNYGLPLPLQRIAENIFKSLPEDEEKNFFASLPEAIGQDGKDLTNIHWKFLASELRNLPPQAVEIQRVIDQVIDGLDLLSQGIQWSEAAEIAEAADKAVMAAAWAAYATDSWVAARAAASASGAADAAALAAAEASYWAAAWAVANAAAVGAAVGADDADAWADAYKASRLRQRDSLLRLIKEAPVKQSH